MLLIRNNAAIAAPVAIPATATKVPFDTTVLGTNGNLALNDSAVDVKTAGIYKSECQVDLTNASSSAAATVTLTAYADGQPVPGATATATIAASSQAAIALPWATKVIAAERGTAQLSWYLSGGAVNLTNAIARVSRVI